MSRARKMPSNGLRRFFNPIPENLLKILMGGNGLNREFQKG